MPDLYFLTGIINAVTAFSLGVFVYLKGHKPLHRYWFLMSICVAGWSLLMGIERLIVDQTVGLVVDRIEQAFAVCIPVLFLHSVMYLASPQPSVRQRHNLRYAYVATILLLATTPTPLFVKTIEPKAVFDWRPYDVAGPLYFLFPVLYTLITAYAVMTLVRAGRVADPVRRAQLFFVAVGGGIGFLAGSTCFPLVFDIPLAPVGFHFVWLYSLVLTYAIFRHGLWDLNVVIRRSLVYSILITLLTVGYFGLVYLVERLFQTTFGYQSIWLSLSAFALMALLFQPLKLGIQRLVDRLFFHAPHEELVKRMERLEHEVRQADKLKAVSTLAAGMAHEIKNPLASLKTFASYLTEKGTDPGFQQKFQRVVTQEIDKIDRIVRRVLEFAKPASPQLQHVQVSKILDETLDFLNNDAVRRRVEVTRSYAPEDTIQADSQQLRQVFLNLFLNSLEAMNGTGGRLSVSTVRNGSCLAVAIEDTGHGIPKEHLQHIFDPFFTTKQSGTGLGLSIVQGIIAEHRGTISVDSEPNKGTRCALTFPLADQ